VLRPFAPTPESLSGTIWYVTTDVTTDAFLADCRARLAFDLLSNTWNAVVLWALRDGPRRPVELRERIGGISSKVLTETLRRLRFNGLVDRQADPTHHHGSSTNSPLWAGPCWRPSTPSAHGPSSTATRLWQPRKQRALPTPTCATIAVRDSKNPAGPVLTFDPAAFTTLVDVAGRGDYSR
jgi:hypothetical protein